MIEPIQGEGGIFPISEAFWERARALATQYDAALIADEIQSGLGRTGRNFAYQKFGDDALPDIVTVAKPLAGGLPLGAFIANEKFAVGVFAGDARLHVRRRAAGLRRGAGIPDRSSKRTICWPTCARVAPSFAPDWKSLPARFDFIREVRGEGLILGIDLSIEGAPFVQEALRRSLLINCTHDHILRLLPPFIIRRAGRCRISREGSKRCWRRRRNPRRRQSQPRTLPKRQIAARLWPLAVAR